MTICYSAFLETVKQRIMLGKCHQFFACFQKCLIILKGFMYMLFHIVYLLVPYYNIQG